MLRLLPIDTKNGAGRAHGRDPDMGIIYREIEAMLLEFEIIKKVYDILPLFHLLEFSK